MSESAGCFKKIRFTINGKETTVDAAPDRRVVDLLRQDMGLTGTKEGCGSGECGACTILIDGEPRLSCLMLAAQLDGRAVTTVEGLANGNELHPLQDAFVRCGAVQCGFCTPGALLVAKALLADTPHPARDRIREELSGNLCRCTGYQKIVDAVEAAAQSAGSVADPGASPELFGRLNACNKATATKSVRPELVEGQPFMVRQTHHERLTFPHNAEWGHDAASCPHSGGECDEGTVMRGTQEDSADAPVGVTFRKEGARATQVFLPEGLDALWSCMVEHPEALVFAGGTDLIVKLRARRAKAAVLIGLERVVELQGVRETATGILIGAGNTHRRLLDDPRISRDFPVLAQALKVLGSPLIRNMGTIGGNICTASPAGDTLPPLYVLGAELELRTKTGIRTLSIAAFITGPGKTALKPGEILTGIRLNRPDGYGVQYYEKVGQRKALACSIASMAALLKISASGVIETARLAWGSVGPTVVTSAEAEKALIGERLSTAVLEKAAQMARQAVSPIDDLRASAKYRRLVSGNLLLRLPGIAGSLSTV